MLVSATAASCATAAASPLLSVDTPVATAGYFVLSWQDAATSDTLILQQSDSPAFTTTTDLTVPANGQLTLSGFPDGAWYFRIGNGSRWSETLPVQVQHHSLATAGRWFLLGLVLFALLVAVILHGARRSGGGNA